MHASLVLLRPQSELLGPIRNIYPSNVEQLAAEAVLDVLNDCPLLGGPASGPTDCAASCRQ